MRPGDPLAEARARVAEEPSLDDGQELDEGVGTVGWLRRLCATTVRVLPASGSGVSLMGEDGIRGVVAASDPVSRVLEDLQVILGEGPCLDAFSARQPVLESDLGGRPGRWPVYAPEARHHGVRAVFAFPLQVGAARLGVLDVYREVPGALSAAALSQALTFAELAVEALLDAQQDVSDGRVPDDVEKALGYRTELYQAQGMVMVDLRVGLAEAMVRLRAYAFAVDRPLGDVVHDIVSGVLRLDDDA